MRKVIIASYIDQEEHSIIDAIAGIYKEVIPYKSLTNDQIPDYIIVSHLEKMHQLRAEIENKKWSSKLIFIGRNPKVEDFFSFEGSAIIDPLILKHKTGNLIVKGFLEQDFKIHLQEIFGDNFSKYFSYKISNIYRIGYFADMICKDAANEKLNFIAIRSFFDHVVMFNSYLVNLGLASFHFELEFSFKEDTLVMLLHIATEGLQHTHLIGSLGEENIKNPLSCLLKLAYNQADYVDVVHHQDLKRLTILGFWLSDEERLKLVTSSISINTIKSLSALNVPHSQEDKKNITQGESAKYSYDFNHHQDPKELEQLDNSALPQLPGVLKLVQDLPEDSILKKEEGVLEEMNSFVQNHIEVKNLDHAGTGNEISKTKVGVHEVKEILKNHSEQELVQQLKEKDEELIASVVSTGKSADELISLIKNKMHTEEQHLQYLINKAVKDIFNLIDKKESIFQKDIANEQKIEVINPSFHDRPIEEILKKPEDIFKEAEFRVNGETVSISDEKKNECCAVLQKSFSALGSSIEFNALERKKQQDIIEHEIKTVIIKSSAENASKNQNIMPAMENIQKDLESSFNRSEAVGDIDDQNDVISHAFIQNSKRLAPVLKKEVPVEEVLEQIIGNMVIPIDKQNALNKNIKKKLQDNSLSKSIDNESNLQITGSEKVIPDQATKISGHTKEDDLSIQVKGINDNNDEEVSRVLRSDKEDNQTDAVKISSFLEGNDGYKVTPINKNGIGGNTKETVRVVNDSNNYEQDDGYTVKSFSSSKDKFDDALNSQSVSNNSSTDLSSENIRIQKLTGMSENEYIAAIDELERKNRHKDLLLEQLKTKIENTEKDHQIQLKRITFDVKRKAQRASSVEVDRYKQKVTSLEREKKAISKMLDDLKSTVYKEKVQELDQEMKESPKVFEFEAQKKRAEVKLSAVELELRELKKTLSSKEALAKEVAEQRYKFEADMNKWKKNALNKQSELEKLHNEKKVMKEELHIIKRKYEDVLKSKPLDKKRNTEHTDEANDVKLSVTTSNQHKADVALFHEKKDKENAQLAREKQELEVKKKIYLEETQKVKALEAKVKELELKLAESVDLKTQDELSQTPLETQEKSSKSNTTAAGANASANKDLAGVATKNRILEESNKKITKDLADSRAKLDEAKKEIANLTKKNNEIQFKLQDKEKLSERLQNELKAIKDKESEAKKKEKAA